MSALNASHEKRWCQLPKVQVAKGGERGLPGLCATRGAWTIELNARGKGCERARRRLTMECAVRLSDVTGANMLHAVVQQSGMDE